MSDSVGGDDVEKLGIVLETSDPERAWNALRLGITAVEDGKDVSVFLLGDGVEARRLRMTSLMCESEWKHSLSQAVNCWRVEPA